MFQFYKSFWSKFHKSHSYNIFGQSSRIHSRRNLAETFQCIIGTSAAATTVTFIPTFLKIDNQQDQASKNRTPEPKPQRKETYVPLNAFEVEKRIAANIYKAEQLLAANKIEEAKKVLENALVEAEQNRAYGNIAYIFDLLSSIAFYLVGVMEAEDLLTKYIERLQQIGFSEDDNNVIRFKLKLSRLYQLVGDIELAEYGFKNCISIQEQKIKSGKFDDASNMLYINCLFWYGRLLQDKQQFNEAKNCMSKAWYRIQTSENVSTQQKMVVLYHNAEICEKLRDFDNALDYLYKAIDLCLSDDKNNPDLPFYIIKVGSIHLEKGVYDIAEYWCESGYNQAVKDQNKAAEMEAKDCLKRLKVFKNKSDSKPDKTAAYPDKPHIPPDNVLLNDFATPP